MPRLPNWRVVQVLKLLLGRSRTDYERLALEQVLGLFEPPSQEAALRFERLYARSFGTREPSAVTSLCRSCGTLTTGGRCLTCGARN